LRFERSAVFRRLILRLGKGSVTAEPRGARWHVGKNSCFARPQSFAGSALYTVARLPFASVRPMAPLIFSRLTIGVKKIGDDDPRIRIAFSRIARSAWCSASACFRVQARSQARRMNLCPPQTFIGINISHAPQHAWSSSNALMRALRIRIRATNSRVHFERIGPEPV